MPRRTYPLRSRCRKPYGWASMRPGRNAPENGVDGADAPRIGPCFNEAGAKCPGERADAIDHVRDRVAASMRPGRNAPENNAA